jgi:hypothetical protein
MLRKIIGFLAPVLLATGLLAFAGPAGASTPGVTTGAFAGYGGTQTDGESPAMSWDVKQQAARVGQPIIAWPNSDSDRALDFVALAPGTGSLHGAKMFIYAPGGRISNLCVAEPFQGAALVLRWCNGSQWQVFVAQQVGSTSSYEWVNQATSDVVSANGIRSPLTGIAPPSTPGPGVEWTFAA